MELFFDIKASWINIEALYIFTLYATDHKKSFVDDPRSLKKKSKMPEGSCRNIDMKFTNSFS